MKNTKREVVERLVPLNYGEIEFLRRLCGTALSALPTQGVTHAARALVDRVEDKLNRAARARYGR